MKVCLRVLPTLLVLVFLLPLLPAARSADTEEKPPTANDGFRPLFNGKNLDGWYTFLQKHGHNNDPDKIIAIEDGVIHLYKHAKHGDKVLMGYIGTDKEHSDYHFRVQYKWGEKKFAPRFEILRDAGIYYHHVGRDFVWPRAMQYQVEKTNIGDIVTVGNLRYDTWVDPKTRDELKPTFMLREDGGVEQMHGQQAGITHLAHRGQWEQPGWNQIEVVCRGACSEHWLNGKLVAKCKNIQQPVEGTGEKKWFAPLQKGKILLEIEAAEIFFRNVEIKDLPPAACCD
jgi:hypothetical protein